MNILAIDAGQTGIRVMHKVLGGSDGSGDPTIRDYAGIRTDRELLPQLSDVVEQFCAATSLPVDIVTAGVSGLTDGESRPDLLLAGIGHLGPHAVFLAHDSISGFLGSLGDRQGAVIAAGTGIVTLGVGPAGIARVDGWGHIVGDTGSGYWIGRAALEAGLRAHDGRGEATALTILLAENFSSPEAAYIELQTNPDRVRFIASFAKQVALLAKSDPVAQKIIRAAGAEMALSVATALRRAGHEGGGSPLVSWAGSLLSGKRLRADFENALRELVPDVTLAAPLGVPLDGVALLPFVAEDNPLYAGIHRATASPGAVFVSPAS